MARQDDVPIDCQPDSLSFAIGFNEIGKKPLIVKNSGVIPQQLLDSEYW